MAIKVKVLKNEYTEESGSASGGGSAVVLAAAIVALWPAVILWKLAKTSPALLLLSPLVAFGAYQAYLNDIYLTVGGGVAVLSLILFFMSLWKSH